MNKIKLVINNDLKKKEKERFFIKKELKCILNLYAKHLHKLQDLQNLALKLHFWQCTLLFLQLR